MTIDELQTWPMGSSESPFRLPLIPHPGWPSTHIRIFDGDARFVARLVPALQLASSERLLATTKTLHDELEDLGVAVPPRLYLIGSRHRDGNPQAFIVARAVEGATTLLAALTADHALAAETDRLCSVLLDYYQTKYTNGGGRLSDLKLEQFVCGTIDGVTAPWMVDLDPGYVEADPATSNARQLASLHWRVAEVANMLILAEQAAGRRLAVARRRFDAQLRSSMFDHPSSHDRRETLTRALADGSPVDGAEWI